MSLGLPIHLAPRGVSLAYSRACHVMAAVCIAIVVATDVTIQLTRDAPPAWLALLPMLAALVLLDRRPSWPFTVVYLFAGGAGIDVHAWILFSTDAAHATDDFVMSMPKIALAWRGRSAHTSGVIARIWTLNAAFSIRTAAFAGCSLAVPPSTTRWASRSASWEAAWTSRTASRRSWRSWRANGCFVRSSTTRSMRFTCTTSAA